MMHEPFELNEAILAIPIQPPGQGVQFDWFWLWDLPDWRCDELGVLVFAPDLRSAEQALEVRREYWRSVRRRMAIRMAINFVKLLKRSIPNIDDA